MRDSIRHCSFAFSQGRQQEHKKDKLSFAPQPQQRPFSSTRKAAPLRRARKPLGGSYGKGEDFGECTAAASEAERKPPFSFENRGFAERGLIKGHPGITEPAIAGADWRICV